MSGLYLHVPLCASRCAYCDFTTCVVDDRGVDHVVRALIFHLDHLSHLGLLDDVRTVYIGGGTPTVLGGRLVALAAHVRGLVAPNLREFTVEANPDSLDPVLVSALASVGVDRVSLGVQSFDDDVLAVLGRRHDAVAAFDAARSCVSQGLRTSVDLMCGVPGQSTASLERSVDTAIATGAGHVSVYPLSLEEGTALWDAVHSGSMTISDEESVAFQMERASSMLGAAGLHRYEVASHARLGQEAVHNVSYWTGEPYIAVGPSAASMLPVERWVMLDEAEGWSHRGRVPAMPDETSRVRFSWESDVDVYLRDPLAAPSEVEFLNKTEATREDLMLAMRMSCGASAELVDEATALDPVLTHVLERLVEEGYLEYRSVSEPESDVAERLCPTHRGWLLGNDVFEAIWTAG